MMEFPQGGISKFLQPEIFPLKPQNSPFLGKLEFTFFGGRFGLGFSGSWLDVLGNILGPQWDTLVDFLGSRLDF